VLLLAQDGEMVALPSCDFLNIQQLLCLEIELKYQITCGVSKQFDK